MNELRQQYKFLFNNMTHGAFFQDADGSLVDVNRAALLMFGLNRDQFSQMVLNNRGWQVFDENGVPLKPEQYPSSISLASGKSFTDFVACVHNPARQGLVWFQANSTPMFRQGEERPYRVFVTLHDITKQRKIAEALATSEKRYRAIVNTQLDFVDRYLPGGILTFVNDALCHYTGLQREELLGKSYYDFIHEADRQHQINRIEALTVDNPVYRANVYAMLPDGSRRWHEWTNHAIFDQDGRLIEYQAVGRDITRQKLAEEALEKSERKYRQLHESMIDGFALTDMDGMILEWNEAFRAMVGFSASEIPRLNNRDITPEKWHEVEDRIIREEVLSRGFSRVYEKEYRRGDGTTLPIELRAYLLKDHNGRAIGMWAIIRDISERKRMENALQQAHDKLEMRVAERTADLARAHEQVKLMSFQLVRAEEQERARLAGELHDQVGQSLLLAKMKVDMLAGELTDMEKQTSANSISTLLENAIHDIRTLTFSMRPPLLDTAGIEAAMDWLCTALLNDYNLQVDFTPTCRPIPLAEGKRYSLFQAVRELLLNVAKHAGVSSAKLDFKVNGNNLVVQVGDTGTGFDQPAHHHRVTMSDGFGLFNVQQRIEQMGGNITIRSTMGAGTEITLSIPLEKETTGEHPCN